MASEADCWNKTPMEYKDYYKTLGLTKKASNAEVKQAYRKFARKYHPDRNQGNTRAEAKC